MAIGRTRAEAMPPHPLTFTTALMASLSLVFNSFSASAFAPTRTFTLGSSSSSLISGTTPSNVILSRASHNSRPIFARTFLEEETKASSTFDPLGYSDSWDSLEFKPTSNHPTRPNNAMAPTTAALTTLLLVPQPSHAAKAIPLSTGDFNPDSFKPVCAASDSFYRFLQGSTRAVVGDENFSEYGPLIAGGLLRIRLELCVVESFFNEAVGPFIKENGLTWILPWHETVETFIAGSIFALATTFILVGSTKIIQILAFYSDLILGGPCRLFGGFFFDRARGEPVTLDVSFLWWKKRLIGPPVDFKEEELKKKLGEGEEKWLDLDNVKAKDVPLLIISGGIKLTGEVLRVVREVVEAVDLFVGRYLVLLASGYIIIKFVHFKIFPDFP